MTAETTRQAIPVIVGPTASGKSELGLSLALQLNGEIINLDSIQVYRRLDIATAKTPPDERRGVAHHLIDIIDPMEPFTAGDYAKLASKVVEDIESRERRPVFVGGTGFYLRALIQPLFESPKTDPALRKRLAALRDEKGPEHLYRMLQKLDPAAARKSSPRNWSRNMRALEFCFQTRRRISEQQLATPAAPGLAARILVIALDPPRNQLYARINDRADGMFERGLVEEVKSLLSSGVPPDAKAFQAHGYRRVVEYLQGARSREEALNQMKLDTRHYAKRQLTWWRGWRGVRWINRFGDDSESVKESLALVREADRALAGG